MLTHELFPLLSPAHLPAAHQQKTTRKTPEVRRTRHTFLRPRAMPFSLLDSVFSGASLAMISYKY